MAKLTTARTVNKKKTGTNWDRLKRRDDREISYADIAELDDNFWKEASLVIPGEKTRITIRIDTDIYQWFKAQGASRYQTRINAVLRSYVEAQRRIKTSKKQKGR